MRFLPALAVLAAVAVAVALFTLGGDAYFRLREAAGMKPYQPFLDLHNVMAAIACWHQGMDVYTENACDVLGRLHIYSPLWLRLPPVFGEPSLLRPLGVALMVGFAASLLWLPAPARGWPAAAVLAAVTSPATAFALERANMDVLMFILAAAGAVLLTGRLAARVGGHALFLLAGLLKFYPLVLLGLLVRERPRDALLLGAAAAVIVAAAVLPLADEYRRAIANIHETAMFWGSFAAHNLPWGLMRLTGAGAAAGAAVAATLVAAAGLVAWRIGAPGDALAALDARTRAMLLAGASVIVGCFAAGESIEYRAIFLLLAMPGLLALAGAGRAFAAAPWVVVALMWDPVLRRIVLRLAPAEGGMLSGPSLLLWAVHELAWWWLAAVLAAVLAGLLRRAPALAPFGLRRAATP